MVDIDYVKKTGRTLAILAAVAGTLSLTAAPSVAYARDWHGDGGYWNGGHRTSHHSGGHHSSSRHLRASLWRRRRSALQLGTRCRRLLPVSPACVRSFSHNQYRPYRSSTLTNADFEVIEVFPN